MSEEQKAERLRREHDSMDDFEHLEHDSLPVQERRGEREGLEHHEVRTEDRKRQENLIDIGNIARSLEESLGVRKESEPSEPGTMPATPPPSADLEKFDAMAQSSDPFQRPFDQVLQVDPKTATMAFMDNERNYAPSPQLEDDSVEDVLTKMRTEMGDVMSQIMQDKLSSSDLSEGSQDSISNEKHKMDSDLLVDFTETSVDQEPKRKPQDVDYPKFGSDFQSDLISDVKSSVIPAPEKSPTLDFLGDFHKEEKKKVVEDDSWNLVEKPDKLLKTEESSMEPPMKPLPPLPKEADLESDRSSNFDKYEMSNDFLLTETKGKTRQPYGGETGDSEFESEPEPSPAKLSKPAKEPEKRKEPARTPYSPPKRNRVEDLEIAPRQIFKDLGLDAWFNPERLTPQVASLIYWRDPKKSGIVLGVLLGVLLSLAYFSWISVAAHLSLLVLVGTICFRIYKTVLQAVQKTSDGHPFKELLDKDLTLPADKVHEITDVAIAHTNATVSELRRLFLVEDVVDSIKFGFGLWALTYVGSWFNGLTLIIIAVIALFTLPKVYETNKAQIDQNLAIVQGKINELTAKVKGLGKKPEPTKEE
ncbi:reticulon-2-like [Prorops nasuta]|uniref:reticulon-2-like n=1 Tax=Prorops nasuta TaxID=863751 RepID=UPI0034CD3308